MSWQIWLAIAIGGGLGAALRHLASAGPWGSLVGVYVANIVGSAMLGGLVAFSGSLSSWWFALLATGLCGALTTYSTFAVQLWEL
ncbi:MAG: CrcB family protein, partial [Ornithinimicrobium sp.]